MNISNVVVINKKVVIIYVLMWLWGMLAGSIRDIALKYGTSKQRYVWPLSGQNFFRRPPDMKSLDIFT